jgi:transposase
MAPGRPKIELRISDQEKRFLKDLISSHAYPEKIRKRCRIIVLASDGHSNTEIARQLNLSNATVGKWRNRFIREGLKGIESRVRSGRPREIKRDQMHLMLKEAIYGRQSNGSHWTCRQLESRTGISKSTVQRTLEQLGLNCECRKKNQVISFREPEAAPMIPIAIQIGNPLAAIALAPADQSLRFLQTTADQASVDKSAPASPSATAPSAPQTNGHGSHTSAFEHFVKTVPNHHGELIDLLARLSTLELPSEGIQIFFTTEDIELAIDLLEWQKKSQAISLHILPEWEDWVHLIRVLSRTVQSSDLDTLLKEDVISVLSWAEKLRLAHAPKTLWFSPLVVGPNGRDMQA